jgi:hypothetical protein
LDNLEVEKLLSSSKGFGKANGAEGEPDSFDSDHFDTVIKDNPSDNSCLSAKSSESGFQGRSQKLLYWNESHPDLKKEMLIGKIKKLEKSRK